MPRGGSWVLVLALLGAPQKLFDIIFKILSTPHLRQRYGRVTGVEFFAGKRAVTRRFLRAKRAFLPYDIIDGKVHFNILSRAGFINAILFCLAVCPGSLALLAIQCTSWVWLCRAQTGRSFWRPLGNRKSRSVRRANIMVTRCVLLILILHARGALVLVEQPLSSLMFRHPRWIWLERMLWASKAGKMLYASLQMKKFGALSVKATVLRANDPAVFDLEDAPGVCTTTQSSQLTVIYENSFGEVKFDGIKKKVKNSQTYTPAFADAVFRMWAKHTDRMP